MYIPHFIIIEITVGTVSLLHVQVSDVEEGKEPLLASNVVFHIHLVAIPVAVHTDK